MEQNFIYQLKVTTKIQIGKNFNFKINQITAK